MNAITKVNQSTILLAVAAAINAVCSEFQMIAITGSPEENLQQRAKEIW